MSNLKMKLIFLSIVLLFSGIFLFSCKQVVEYQDIEGNWTLIRATRNGKPTQTLENVFFDFSTENRMMTNLLGSENTFNINYNYPAIKIENSSELERLTVKKLVHDTLHLELRLMNYKYDFFLMRTESN